MKNNDKKIKYKSNISVLLSPAHYMIMDGVSEYGWPYNIIKEISEHNIKFHAIANNIENNLVWPKNISIYKLGIESKKTNLITAYFYIKCFLKSIDLIRKEKIDIIHHMLPFSFESTFNLIPVLNMYRGKPFIIGPLQNPQFFDPIENPYSFNIIIREKSKPFLKQLFIKTINRADKLIVVNKFTKNLYLKYATEDKIELITPGVDIKEFRYSKTKNSVFEILFAGNLIKRKGVEYLLKAFKILLRNYKNIQLRIVGDGDEKENLIKLSNDLGIKDKVIFDGLVPHEKIKDYYKKCDIFVLPTLSESFGMVLLEAMASGKPCVASDVVGPNEIIMHGKTGYLFTPKNENELANYISILIENEKLRIKMGKNARRIAEKKYDWKKIAEKYYNIYKSFME